MTPLEEAAALTKLVHKGVTLNDVVAQTGLSAAAIRLLSRFAGRKRRPVPSGGAQGSEFDRSRGCHSELRSSRI